MALQRRMVFTVTVPALGTEVKNPIPGTVQVGWGTSGAMVKERRFKALVKVIGQPENVGGI